MDVTAKAGASERVVSVSKPKVAVLMGGKSAEREISLVTGAQITGALRSKGYDVLTLDTAEDFLPRLQLESPDVAFIALHGRLGEDGTMQGLLEILEIPYAGSGVLSSAMAMDKVISKKIFASEEIPTPEFTVARQGEALESDRAVAGLGLPLVVKPSCEGSAIGVSIVHEAGELPKAIDEALASGGDVLIERYITGVEITVGVLEQDGEARALPTVEIVPANEMYDYEAKYTPGMSQHIIPARIPEEQRELAQELAVKAHRALCCSGFSRVDFIVSHDGPYTLEVNTIPGMTGTSLFPEAAKAAGIEFPDLVERLVQEAVRTKTKSVSAK